MHMSASNESTLISSNFYRTLLSDIPFLYLNNQQHLAQIQTLLYHANRTTGLLVYKLKACEYFHEYLALRQITRVITLNPFELVFDLKSLTKVV